MKVYDRHVKATGQPVPYLRGVQTQGFHEL